MISQIVEYIIGLPWARITYTTALLAFAAVLAREVVVVWSPKKVTLGKFTYFDEGTTDDGRASSIAMGIRHHQSVLNKKFELEHKRLERQEVTHEATETKQVAQLPRGVFSPGGSSNLLEDLDVSVQGVNFSKLFTATRRAVSPPNEVFGSVSRRKERVSATISWPNAPSIDGRVHDNQLMHLYSEMSDDELSEMLACSMSWAHSVGTELGEIQNIDHIEFCKFVKNWSRFVEIREKAELEESLTEGEVLDLVGIAHSMERLIEKDIEYSEVYLLHAKSLDMLPSPNKEQRAKAITSLRVFERREEATSLAKIRKQLESVKTTTDVASAVGFIRNRRNGQSFVGSGWVAATDIVATATFVALEKNPLGDYIPNVEGIEFVIASDVGAGESQTFEASEVVFLSDPMPGMPEGLVLIKVPGLAKAGVNPILFSGNKPTVGSHAAVWAFSSSGRRTMSVGQTVAVIPENSTIIHSARTSPGSAGGPIIDESNRVIGVHLGGLKSGAVEQNYGKTISTDELPLAD